MPEPDAANARRRDGKPALPELVGDAHLAESRLLDGKLNDGALDLFGDAVLEHRLLAGNFGKRDLPAFLVQLLEAVEAVPAIPHHLAGLAHIAELLGQLQQTNFRADNFLIFGHDVLFLKTPKHGA